jgi:hypothetical protein
MRESFSKVCALATVRNDDDLEMDDESVWRVNLNDVPELSDWPSRDLISINLVESNSPWPYLIFNADVEASIRGKRIWKKPRS